MRSHQQRVPIISPLDRDYRRSSYSADDLNFSSSSLSSYKDSSNSPGNSAALSNAYSERNDQLFTIVGEREFRD